MSDFVLLSLLWALPLAGSIGVLFIPKRAELAIKVTSLVICSVTFLLTLIAFYQYVTPTSAGGNAPASVSLQERAEKNVWKIDPEHRDTVEYKPVEGDLVVRNGWIPYFNIQYFLGLDGISLSLVLLTGFVSVLACLASWNIEKQLKGYFSLFLLLLASMLGVFLALDMFLFYVFFEVMLLPMYFLIGVWGGENREYAAIKFLLYTLFGSVFILVAILLLYFWVGPDGRALHSFDAVWLSQVVAQSQSASAHFSPAIQQWIFALFFTGFCIKLPSFPFHTWLPDAHVQAPTPISMILAGILLKIGGYGLIRLAWPLAPVGAQTLSIYVATLGVFSILYGALVAMAQTDFKKLVAYSSVSHMGYVTLGMAVMAGLATDPRYYAFGVNGAMFMMIAHGITSTGMFFLVGVIYERAHTRDLNKLGGLLNYMPGYGLVSFVIFFGSMGLPGLCGFIAEVFVLLAAFQYSIWLSVLAASAVILTAGYILWTLQRVFLGRNEHYRGLPDLNLREWVIGAPLVVMTVVLGIFPQSLLSWMGPSVRDVIKSVAQANGGRPEAAPRVSMHVPVRGVR
jgi:NADH-quinone oxidoreductase subunit M